VCWDYIISLQVPLIRLFSDLVNDSLTEFAYDADLAGLSYNFASNTLGVSISVKGYNDKLPVLAGTLLEKIKGLKIKPERLSVVKEQVRFWNHCLSSYSRIVVFSSNALGRTSS
jgi:insulysin